MARKTTTSGAARKSAGKAKAAAATTRAEEASFTRSLVAHGQAVRIPAGGELPAGATHELVEDETGELRPVRRRFSAI